MSTNIENIQLPNYVEMYIDFVDNTSRALEFSLLEQDQDLTRFLTSSE